MALAKALKDMGFIQSKADPVLFARARNEGSYKEAATVILAYVGDLLIVTRGDENDAKAIVGKLSKAPDLRLLGEARHFLGIEIERATKKRFVKISQKQHIADLLKKRHMSNCKANKAILPAGSKLTKDIRPQDPVDIQEVANLPYRSLVGALLYLANCARPDIAHVVGALSRFARNLRVKHWLAAKQALRNLKGAADLGIA